MLSTDVTTLDRLHRPSAFTSVKAHLPQHHGVVLATGTQLVAWDPAAATVSSSTSLLLPLSPEHLRSYSSELTDWGR